MEIKDNKGITILAVVLILILLVIGLSGYLVYDKLQKDNEIFENHNNSNLNSDFITEIVDFKNCNPYDGGTQNVCMESKTINNKVITLRYELKNYRQDIESDFGASLNINDHLILSPELGVMGINNKVYLFNDIVMYSTYDTDIRSTHIYFYDFNGNKIKEIIHLDNDNYGMAMSSEDDYFVNGKTIIFNGSRLTHGPSLVSNIDSPIIEDFGGIPLCRDNEEKDKLTGEEIIEAKYTMNYLGNKEFSEIKMILGTEKKLNEYLKTLNC